MKLNRSMSKDCISYDEFEQRKGPFPHLVIAPALSSHEADVILKVLQKTLWISYHSSLYSFEVSQDDARTSALYDHLTLSPRINYIRDLMSDQFDVNLEHKLSIDMHRYKKRSGIGAHTDSGVTEARFVLNINNGWVTSHGG